MTAYLSSIPISDAPEGMFARVLRHNVSGHRYVPPAAPERSRGKSASRYVSKPLVSEAASPKRTRAAAWTSDRIDALPLTSGFLTRFGYEQGQTHYGTIILARCAGTSPACRKTVRCPAANWARDTARPRACKGCGHEARKKAMSVPLNDKGYAFARGFSAKNKRKTATSSDSPGRA